MQANQTQNKSYGHRFWTRWLPIYLVVGGIIYLIVYLAFMHHGGSGGGGSGGY